MSALSLPFMQALQQVELSRDVTPLVELFAEDARLENPARSVAREGRVGATRFWREYLSAFDEIRSEFTHVREADGFATLEWKSTGKLPTGRPVTYRGVSLIESADGGEARVKRFCTYYDSATFLPDGSKHTTDRAPD